MMDADAHRKINNLQGRVNNLEETVRQALAELASKPEAGEFTKRVRKKYPKMALSGTELQAALTIIDQQAAENKRLKEHIQKLEIQLGLCKDRFKASNVQAELKRLKEALERLNSGAAIYVGGAIPINRQAEHQAKRRFIELILAGKSVKDAEKQSRKEAIDKTRRGFDQALKEK